ncbi:MAG: peptidylprolyl isomerase [Cycloclasticus sp. symbiont of Poecilosclerida sp. N]|nr:MAG: peptidylprolyl isomerase [Cycloclasticus sp. symbiont of Poecilosclerida sp. N]
MLDRLRRHVKGWLGIVILIMISIPFALFGLQNYSGGGLETPVAEVGDYKIYQTDVTRAYQQRVGQLKEQYADKYSDDMFSEKELRLESLNRLVQERLVLQTVNDDGYVASEKAIIDVISTIDVFQKDGRFDKETYMQILQARGMVTNDFVQQVKVGLERDQFVNSIVETTLVDGSEIEDFYRLNNQTRDIRYISLQVASIIDDMQVTEDEIKENFADNQHLYKTPEIASIEYVELNLESLMEDLSATESELLAFYESEKQVFTEAGHRRASHILFEAEDGTPEAEAEKKRAKAEEVLTKINNGGDFAQLAKEFSDDLGSATTGGDLGIITDGMMDSVFEETLASLENGGVSGVIQTSHGFHIIKLTNLEEDTVQPYDIVKNKVAELYKRNIAAEKFYQLSERFAELGFENPDSLDPIVDELGLLIKKQADISEKITEGIAASDKVRHAVFSEDVLAGNNSEVVEVGTEHLVILRVTGHKLEEVMLLDDVRDAVELSVKSNKAQSLLNDKIIAMLATVKSGESITTLAKSPDVTLTDIGSVKRNDRSVPEVLLRDAFSMTHPVDNKPSYKQSVLSNGDAVIIELSKITDGDKADITDASRESFKKFLTRLTGEVTLAASLANLSVEANVVLPKDMRN